MYTSEGACQYDPLGPAGLNLYGDRALGEWVAVEEQVKVVSAVLGGHVLNHGPTRTPAPPLGHPTDLRAGRTLTVAVISPLRPSL